MALPPGKRLRLRDVGMALTDAMGDFITETADVDDPAMQAIRVQMLETAAAIRVYLRRAIGLDVVNPADLGDVP